MTAGRGLVLFMFLAPISVLIPACATTVSEPPPELAPASFPARPAVMKVNLAAQPDLPEVLATVKATPAVGATREAILREEALREQAGLPPNPILNILASRIDSSDLGSGPHKYRVFLRERLETGGKRDARILTATGRYHEALAEARVSEFLTARAAAGAHQRAVASRELLILRRQALSAARELLTVEERLVDAGRRRASVLPRHRERVATLQTAVLEEEATLTSALRNLEGILSVSPGTLIGVRGDLLTAVALPVAADGPLIDHSPAVRVAVAAEEIALAELSAAKAKAYPDVTVGVEYENNREFGETFNLFGLNVESALPVINTNQAGIRAAHAEVRRAEVLFAEARAGAAASYAEAREVAATLKRGVRSRQTGVVPARAQEADFARLAFQAGRTDRRPLLTAELALLEARIDLTELRSRVAGWNLDALVLLGREPAEWTAPPGELPSR